MSVVVFGMEMPEDCWHCAMGSAVGSFDACNVAGRIWDPDPGQPKRPGWCPLRPLPKKHGRLIEADSLKEQLEYYIREAGWDVKTNCALGWVKDEFIDREMTVVEAEGDN